MLYSSSSSNSSAAEDMDVKRKRKMDDRKENDGLLIRPCLSMEFNKQGEEEEEEEHSSPTSAAANTTLLYEEELCEEEEEVKTPPASPRKRRWECPGAPRKAKAKKRKSWSEEDDEGKRMAHSHLCRHLESLFPPAVNKRLKHRPITGS